MKNSHSIETLKTSRSLKTEEQNSFRLKFEPLLRLTGIITLCLEGNELYVEYNPEMFNLDSFKSLVLDMGFPLELDEVLV